MMKIECLCVFECLCVQLIFGTAEKAKINFVSFQSQPVRVRVISYIFWRNLVLEKFQ